MGDTLSNTHSSLELAALQYFLDNAHPKTGLVRDAALNFKKTPHTNTRASIAATGFALVVIANAATRGLVSAQFAEDYVFKTLAFIDKNIPRHKGWFVHFVNWASGKSLPGSEFSTIDTAFVLAGALYAAQVFPGSKIYSFARRIYEEADFHALLSDGGAKPEKMTLSMAYHPDEGYSARQWNMYGEQMILLLLGLGHPTHPLPPECWLAWRRKSQNLLAPPNLMGIDEALFVHQYSHVFIDFRKFRDVLDLDYYMNSVNVSRYHRDLMHNSVAVKTLKAGFWGFSAGDAPGGEYCVYNALDRKGTVCIGAALGSAMFMPEEILSDAAKWKAGTYGEKIWGTYGFSDSLDLDENWFGQQALGITVGPIFMSLANIYDETSIWKLFMEIPEIKLALQKAAAARLGVSL